MLIRDTSKTFYNGLHDTEVWTVILYVYIGCAFLSKQDAVDVANLLSELGIQIKKGFRV